MDHLPHNKRDVTWVYEKVNVTLGDSYRISPFPCINTVVYCLSLSYSLEYNL